MVWRHSPSAETVSPEFFPRLAAGLKPPPGFRRRERNCRPRTRILPAWPVAWLTQWLHRVWRPPAAEASGHFDQIVVTQYVTNPRAARVERLISACCSAGLPPPQVAATPVAAMELAKQLATPEGFVCVAGSFFLAAEIQAGPSGRPPNWEKNQG